VKQKAKTKQEKIVYNGKNSLSLELHFFLNYFYSENLSFEFQHLLFFQKSNHQAVNIGLGVTG